MSCSASASNSPKSFWVDFPRGTTDRIRRKWPNGGSYCALDFLHVWAVVTHLRQEQHQIVPFMGAPNVLMRDPTLGIRNSYNPIPQW